MVRRLRGAGSSTTQKSQTQSSRELEHEAGQPTAVARSTSALSGASTGSRTPTEREHAAGHLDRRPRRARSTQVGHDVLVGRRVLPGDPVGPGRVEAGQQHGGRRLGDEGVDGRHDVPGLAGVRGDDARHDQRRVGVVAAHQPPGREHRPDPLVQRHPGRDLGGGSGSSPRRSHSMPKWPSRAVAARKSSRWVRPVVCATGPPRWAPSISGGTSSEVQRWIRCRSTASMVSLGHTRSVRVSTSRSIRPPPLAQVSISSRGCASRSSSSSR